MSLAETLPDGAVIDTSVFVKSFTSAVKWPHNTQLAEHDITLNTPSGQVVLGVQCVYIPHKSAVPLAGTATAAFVKITGTLTDRDELKGAV